MVQSSTAYRMAGRGVGENAVFEYGSVRSEDCRRELAGREVANVADLGVGVACWVAFDLALEYDSYEMDLQPVACLVSLRGGVAVDAEQPRDLDGQARLFHELSLRARPPSLAGFEAATGKCPGSAFLSLNKQDMPIGVARHDAGA